VELTEDLIQRIHGLVEKANERNQHPTAMARYHPRFNSGKIVYLPPESKDVPGLMAEMVGWVKKAQREKFRSRLSRIASLSICNDTSLFDGNGRTAVYLQPYFATRQLRFARFFLHGRTSCKGFGDYYQSLSVHDHHNYYLAGPKLI